MKNLVAIFLLMHVLFLGPAFLRGEETQVLQPAVDIQAFITQSYELGVPCEQARAYGRPAGGELLSMLEDRRYEPYWENVVVTLGCIGDPSFVEPLEKFLETHKGAISFETFSALQSVPTALGFLSQSGDEKALVLLTRLSDEEYWKQAKLNVFGQVSLNNRVVEKSLMRSTIIALGNSGRKEAHWTLKMMKDDPILGKDYRDEIELATEQ